MQRVLDIAAGCWTNGAQVVIAHFARGAVAPARMNQTLTAAADWPVGPRVPLYLVGKKQMRPPLVGCSGLLGGVDVDNLATRRWSRDSLSTRSESIDVQFNGLADE